MFYFLTRFVENNIIIYNPFGYRVVAGMILKFIFQ